jgi:hypothetical protein
VGDHTVSLLGAVMIFTVLSRHLPDDSKATDRTMTHAGKRSIVRSIHLVLTIPIAGYVYSPFANLPQYAGPTRFVFFPVLVLSGLWMWKGHCMSRLFSRRPE